VYRGILIECALLDADATTLVAGTVLQTQIEYVTEPPGLVLELCCTSWPVTQSAPALCDLLGDGDGLVDLVRDFDGEGLGERDLDGLGLVVADGLGLFDWLGEPVGLCEALVLGLLDGLGLLEELALEDGLVVAASRCADSAAAEPWPHGELISATVEANAGAIAMPDARKDPATMATATRPARKIPTGIVALRSSRQPSGHVFEHKLATWMTEVAGGNARAFRFIMILFRQRITSVPEMAV